MDIVIISNVSRDFSNDDNWRITYIASKLAINHNVELITSDFYHAGKVHRNSIPNKNYSVTMLHEIGYKKNISLRRFASHYYWGKQLKKYLKHRRRPDVIYCAVPTINGSLEAAKYCKKNRIKFIIDIQDLWPESFYMAFNVPIVSKLIFWPIKHRVDKVYSMADEICGVSRTFVDRATSCNKKALVGHPVYIGTEIQLFDKHVTEHALKRNDGEFWIGYCGTIANSYDLQVVIDAIASIEDHHNIRFVVIGDGPKRQQFEDYAKQKQVLSSFLGRKPYSEMCGYLSSCDVVVNPIIGKSVASIINKHADYAAAGLPVLNTQVSKEYRDLIDLYQMGVNSKPGDSQELNHNIVALMGDSELRTIMGKNARKCAEELFDRKKSYEEIFCVIEGRKNQ